MSNSIGTSYLTHSLKRKGLKMIDRMSLVYLLNSPRRKITRGRQAKGFKVGTMNFPENGRGWWFVTCVYKLGCWRITAVWICDCHNLCDNDHITCLYYKSEWIVIWQGVICPMCVLSHLRHGTIPWWHHTFCLHFWWVRRRKHPI